MLNEAANVRIAERALDVAQFPLRQELIAGGGRKKTDKKPKKTDKKESKKESKKPKKSKK
jgi:hypothetical protein